MSIANSKEVMRIAVVGPGGLGGRYGVILAQAGEEVSLIARGAHLKAIREKGLTLRERRDVDVTVEIPATDDPSEVGRWISFCSA